MAVKWNNGEIMEESQGIMKVSNPKHESHYAHLRKVDKHLVIKHKDTTLAETRKPIVLTEHGKFIYDSVYYISKDDVMVRMVADKGKTTHCPIKGDAHYWNWDELKDVAWSYEKPLDQAKILKGFVSFDLDKVDLLLLSE